MEFQFAGDTYMVWPHSHRGRTVLLTLQARTSAIAVAKMIARRGLITDIEWETPFSGRSQEWRDTLRTLVQSHAATQLAEVSR
ncbi:hypothetical protein [Natronoglycomyces albus]|uniref:Uncharacterized protein n=1 Tax=Natronoglycomyces albus TaxID=2811108 RepID=A0A895XVL0_9ACTN|nr:hypothetical protein [Natronoglycomyces albus]QSB06260.1 hypothetical protein JQS30_04955 [Natronoglycomyces albus]